jgi:hypothetical protein
MKSSTRDLGPILSAASHGPYGTFGPILNASGVSSRRRAPGAPAGTRQSRPVHTPARSRIDAQRSRLATGLVDESRCLARPSRRHDDAMISAFLLDLHGAAALLRDP